MDKNIINLLNALIMSIRKIGSIDVKNSDAKDICYDLFGRESSCGAEFSSKGIYDVIKYNLDKLSREIYDNKAFEENLTYSRVVKFAIAGGFIIRDGKICEVRPSTWATQPMVGFEGKYIALGGEIFSFNNYGISWSLDRILLENHKDGSIFLRDVEFENDKFCIHSNRFELFDRDGRHLNSFDIARVENYLDLKVLETKESGYSSAVYFVGFKTLHIKLDFYDDDCLGDSDRKFGVDYVDRSH